MPADFAEFKARAEAVSAEVHRVRSRSDARELILGILEKEGIADAPQSYAVWAPGSLLEGCDTAALTQRRPGLHFEVTRERAAAAKIGITQMDWAVANTGTLAQCAQAIEQRLASSLSTIHIAVVPTDRMVPDLAALLGKLSPRETGYLALITGPSRTADIERVLTIGVHGPERLIIVFVEEMPS